MATTLAFDLLKKRKSTEVKAEQYAKRVSESIKLKVINTLEEKIDDIDDKIFDLENFSLETDHNKGLKQLTKEDIEARFTLLIELGYQKDLLQAELDSKKASFSKYFGENVTEEVAAS